MATYYVRTDGSDSNTGLGSTTGLAWKTIQKALGASGIASGDTVYIAPGAYVEQVTVGGTYTVATNIIGDPLCTQFTGVSTGPVRLSAFLSDSSAPTFTSNQLVATSKNYLQFSNILFDLGNSTTGNAISLTNCRYWSFDKCAFQCNTLANNNAASLYISGTGTTAFDFTINKCIFYGNSYPIYWTKTGSVTDTTKVSNCLIIGSGIINYHTQVLYINNTFNRGGIFTGANASASFPLGVYNCLFLNITGGSALSTNISGAIVENYNRFIGCSTPRTNVSVGANSTDVGVFGFSQGYELLVGLPSVQFYGSILSSVNANFGTTTNASASDMFGVTWTGANPDAGSVTYRNIGSVGSYLPTDRNASTITIAPGSTSQSIELYLGATGLTASTSGLSARYNRTRTASVSIPLVARTIAQAWTAGGFAEVDATNMPGIYRLDLPDAALAAGADDVTVVVRGASGTNGAVMTIKLSSGGLTSAQTASAVWDAATASYTANGTFGLNVLRADQQNKAGNVTLHSSGNVNRVDADVHAIANDADAATELKGALLHNGTDYISAELLTPVSAATSVHIGPYQLLADGLGADQPLDVNVGTATSIDVQVTDANGTGIDITGATVSAKVYNSGGTLVATYAGTATYADNGRLTFGLTTTVTNTSGTYTVTVTRTTGASDTQVFGPLKLYVRPV
jgi:hypothetical protein